MNDKQQFVKELPALEHLWDERLKLLRVHGLIKGKLTEVTKPQYRRDKKKHDPPMGNPQTLRGMSTWRK